MLHDKFFLVFRSLKAISSPIAQSHTPQYLFSIDSVTNFGNFTNGRVTQKHHIHVETVAWCLDDASDMTHTPMHVNKDSIPM
jgi:hypothetical protein